MVRHGVGRGNMNRLAFIAIPTRAVISKYGKVFFTGGRGGIGRVWRELSAYFRGKLENARLARDFQSGTHTFLVRLVRREWSETFNRLTFARVEESGHHRDILTAA